MKKILLFLVALFVATKAFAYEAQIDGIYYNFDQENKTAIVTYDGDYDDDNGAGYTQSEIIIPEKVRYNGVEYSVTEIGNFAFNGCTGLTSIEIPNSVTEIGYFAFRDCTGLTSIEIPKSVTEIGDYAFSGCTGLTSIEVDNDNQNYASVDGVLYNKNITTVICCLQGKTSIEIPNSVTSIGGSAFEGCTGLTSIEIPNSVTSIGSYAFEGCTGLTSIEIPNSVTSIGSYAFGWCTGLTSITIGENVTSIGDDSFWGCDNLNIVVWNVIKYSNKNTTIFDGSITSFIFGDKVEYIPASLCNELYKITSITIGENVTSIESNAFENCRKLTTVVWNAIKYNESAYDLFKGQITSFTFGNKVEYIPSDLCRSMKELTSITIPNSVTSIGGRAFKDCIGLTSIIIGENVTSIGHYAFEGCIGLTSIIIGENVTEIGVYAFNGCTGLTSIEIPNSVTSIGGSAFKDCIGLTSIIIGENVTSIGNSAFDGCTGLTSIEIPNSVTSIGSYAFNRCTGLTSIEIPNSVTKIGDYPFEGCTGLTSIIIGNGVTEIDETIFYNCTGLTSIVIGKGITSINKNAFKDCSSLALVKWNAKRCNDFSSEENPFATKPITSFTFGDDVERIPAYLCYNKTDLSSIVIPNLVTEIGESAFESCGKLRTVEIGKSITSIEGKAFAGCSAIYSMGIDAIIPPIVESSTFENVSRTTQIKVPCSAVAAYQASSYWNEFTNYIETPNTLSVEVNDNTMGMAVVTKQNTCTDITATVQAQARPGYEFVKWSDGFTENPHTVFVMEDMTITAEFAPVAKEYNVSVVCDATMGSVNGSGTYKEGESVTIEAVANQGYYFVKWSDGNTENPRTIVVAEDVILTAEFELDVTISVENTEDSSAIIYVRNGMIYVEGIETYYHVLDVAGRLVYIGRDAMLSLPRGVYVVVVGDEVQKVVL